MDRVKEEFPQDVTFTNWRYDSGGYLRFSLDGARGRNIIEVASTYHIGALRNSYRMEVNNRDLLASRWAIKKLFKYVYNIWEKNEEDEDFRNISADLMDPDFAEDVFDDLNDMDVD